ncbi:MAG TPA: hypothetical protein VFO63_09370 [Blastocatellia bacterium]|nr:hypothetical protein [Blastocatellia bacterium]
MAPPASLARRLRIYAHVITINLITFILQRRRRFPYQGEINEQPDDRESETGEHQIFLIHKVERA